MADDSVCLTFLGIDGGFFRFGDVLDELDGVKLPKSPDKQVTNKWIRGPYNRCLIFNGSEFEQRNLNDAQRSRPENKLNINYYQKGTSINIDGRLVTLYVHRGTSYYAVVCNTDGTVVPENITKQELDGSIDSSHRALFEMVQIGSTDTFKFRSIQANKCLGFNESSCNVLGLVNDPENQYMGFDVEKDGVSGNV